MLRAEVRTARVNGTLATLAVTDPGVKDGPVLEASINAFEKEYAEAVARTNPGAVVVLIGEGRSASGGVWDVRILYAPPEGVTLPGDTK